MTRRIHQIGIRKLWSRLVGRAMPNLTNDGSSGRPNLFDNVVTTTLGYLLEKEPLERASLSGESG